MFTSTQSCTGKGCVITMVILQIRTHGTVSPTPEISTTTFDVMIIKLYITVMINGSTKTLWVFVGKITA